ncbi:MAG TPA: hypothetical protein VF855_07080 [Acidimicrobiales bacterium]
MFKRDNAATASEHAVPEHPASEHDEPTFSEVDRTFGKSVAFGYVGGFLVLGLFFFLVMSWAGGDSTPLGARIAVSIGIGFWIGIMGGVVAVGRWAARHEHEIFH